MTTNNPLDQKPENAEKQAQEENSIQSNEKEVQEKAPAQTDPLPSLIPDVSGTEEKKKKTEKAPVIDATDTEAVKQDKAPAAPEETDPEAAAKAVKKKKAAEPKAVKKPSKAKAVETPEIKHTDSSGESEEPASPQTTDERAGETTETKAKTARKPRKTKKEDDTGAGEKKDTAKKTEQEEQSEEADQVTAPVAAEPIDEGAKPEAQKKDKPGDPEEIIDELPDEDEEDHDDEDQEDDETDSEETRINYDALPLEELVSLLEKIVQEEEITALRKKVAIIKVAFLRKHKAYLEEKLETIAKSEEDEEEGEEEKDELGARFNEAFDIYSEKRKAYLEQQEVQKQKNLESKMLILEELKALIESEESLKKTYDDFKELQDKWKAIGMVPKGEVNNLWQNYHFYVEKFFDKVKINKELRDLDLKKNLELKIELCEKAEELLLETSILKSFKQLQQYHRQWKEIGPVPQDKKDELWDRFRSTTEKINLARRDHYNQLKGEQENNLASKTALCEKAEEILQRDNNTVKEWQENTREISELLKVWKTIGQAPRKENDEIWDRFKTSMDTFFAGKKEYFQGIKEEQLNNYNLKLDLCSQAEAIKNSTDWKETTRELINLQKEWKKIGPVPRKHSDKIWHRFRAACDEFFNSKSEYFSNRKTHETDNLKAKEELIKKVGSYDFGKDKSDNLEILKGFQREWTEIGHVPFKEKDRLQNEFRKAINDQLDQLKISKSEMQTINYKQRFENIRENPNAGRIVRNERYFLQQKVKKLEEEIQLLENNMGFLAKSKKADLLKAEFTKKIENARIEVDVLKEKIKFLERETE